MSNRSDSLVAFLLGAVVGASVALLLAPASGEETRRKLGEGAKKLGHDLDDRLHQAKSELGKHAQNLKEQISSRSEDVRTAVAAGREAYSRSRTGGEPGGTADTL